MYRNLIMSSITFRKGMIKKKFSKNFFVSFCVMSCRVLYKTCVLSCHIVSFGQSTKWIVFICTFLNEISKKISACTFFMSTDHCDKTVQYLPQYYNDNNKVITMRGRCSMFMQYAHCAIIAKMFRPV